MKIYKAIPVIFLNAVAVQSFSFPYKSFKDVLSDRAILHGLTHNHPKLPIRESQPSRISKILQFQKGKILRAQNKHFNQGNMNISSRAEFLDSLGTKFKNVKAYSKKRIRKDYEKISRRGGILSGPRISKIRTPRRRFKLSKFI